jgi:hypothetical protein
MEFSSSFSRRRKETQEMEMYKKHGGVGKPKIKDQKNTE